jgi:hypothetical protein
MAQQGGRRSRWAWRLRPGGDATGRCSSAAAAGDRTRAGRGAALLHGLLGAGKEWCSVDAARQWRWAAGSAGGAPGRGCTAGGAGFLARAPGTGRGTHGTGAGAGGRDVGWRGRPEEQASWRGSLARAEECTGAGGRGWEREEEGRRLGEDRRLEREADGWGAAGGRGKPTAGGRGRRLGKKPNPSSVIPCWKMNP